MRNTVPSAEAIEAVVKVINTPEISSEMLQTAFEEGRALYMGTTGVIIGFILFVPVVSNSAFVELKFVWVHQDSRNQGVLDTLLRRILFKFRRQNILTLIPGGNTLKSQVLKHNFQEVVDWSETPQWLKMLPGANKKHCLFWRMPTPS